MSVPKHQCQGARTRVAVLSPPCTQLRAENPQRVNPGAAENPDGSTPICVLG